jgi:hypothetical protein
MNSGETYARSNDNNLYQRGPNPNLNGMNTQFQNMMSDNNNLQHSDIYNKYNVIEKKDLQYTLKKKPYKVIIAFSNKQNANTFVVILDRPIKDIVSVKLLNGYYTEKANTTPPNFITIKIDELNKNIGDSVNTNSLNDSFATLNFDSTHHYAISSTTSTGPDALQNFYKNTFATHEDIKYFDPPLNALSKLSITLTGSSALTQLATSVGKLELMIETKEKLRVY